MENRPSYIYLAIFRITTWCGDGYLNCARIINVIFFIGSIPLIYLVARTVTSAYLAVFIALLTGLGPINSYTAYFMHESMYFFMFWVVSFVILKGGIEISNVILFVIGILLGIMTLIKVHALFLIPAFSLYIIFNNTPLKIHAANLPILRHSA
jgi:phosphoglycerol transferase